MKNYLGVIKISLWWEFLVKFRVPLLEPITVTLGPFSESHTFLLCDTALANFLGGGLLSILGGHTKFSSGEIVSRLIRRWVIMCSQSPYWLIRWKCRCHRSLWNPCYSVGLFHWYGKKIRSVKPIRIQINPSKLLLQYPLKLEATKVSLL